MESDIESKTNQISLIRRAKAMAYAFLQRGHKAGIPDRFLRIDRDQFKNILCPSYHNDTDSVADFVYKRTEDLMTTPYILIDGGGSKNPRYGRVCYII